MLKNNCKSFRLDLFWKQMFKPDKPIEKIERDLLGRAPFAENIARDIIAWDAKKDSLVIGLYAGWGYGKTSVINFIKQYFQDPSLFAKNGGASVTFDQVPTVIEFNPWVFSNQGNLIFSFLLEVGKELGQRGNERDKRIAKKLKLVKAYLQTANFITEKFKFILRALIPLLGLSISLIWAIVSELPT